MNFNPITSNTFKILQSKSDGKGGKESLIEFNGVNYKHNETTLCENGKILLSYFYRDGMNKSNGTMFSSHGSWGPKDGMTRLKHSYNFMVHHGEALLAKEILSSTGTKSVDRFSGGGEFSNYSLVPLDYQMASDTTKQIFRFMQTSVEDKDKIGVILSCEAGCEGKLPLSDFDKQVAPLFGNNAIDMFTCRSYNLNHIEKNKPSKPLNIFEFITNEKL